MVSIDTKLNAFLSIEWVVMHKLHTIFENIFLEVEL